jgi:hypothetical protein
MDQTAANVTDEAKKPEDDVLSSVCVLPRNASALGEAFSRNAVARLRRGTRAGKF